MRGVTSAPTERVIDVLELLARPSGARLRFSDITAALGLTQGTTHSVLKTLCDRGWVARDPVDKTFTLGPALAVVAARMDSARPLTQSARAAAVALTAAVDLPTSVVERAGESLVITAFEGAENGHPAGTPGAPIPYTPPFGVAFAAWDSVAEQRAWIARASGSNPELVGRLEEVLERTRDRGYDIDWMTPALAQTAQAVSTMQDQGVPEHLRVITEQLLVECTATGLLAEDDPARKTQPVATVAAPVFDHRQRVALILCVHPLRRLAPRETSRIGTLLTRETAALSAALQAHL